jgi:hypothetical protein
MPSFISPDWLCGNLRAFTSPFAMSVPPIYPISINLPLPIFFQIEIEYFPFDTQECLMKFGGWTYNGFLMNISQIPVNLLWPKRNTFIHIIRSGQKTSPNREVTQMAVNIDTWNWAWICPHIIRMYIPMPILQLPIPNSPPFTLLKEFGMGFDVGQQQSVGQFDFP